MWNGVPAPAMVTSCSWMSAMVFAGSKRSMYTVGKPTTRALNSQPMPPMWVNGNTTAFRSGSVTSRHAFIPRALARIVRSVCCAPFGSAVVPDV